MKKLKIGQLTDNYPCGTTSGSAPGGIGTYSQLIAEELTRLGHEAHVFTFSPTNRHVQTVINGVHVWECPAWGKRREMPFLQSAEFTVRYKNDALKLNHYSLALAAKKAVKSGIFDLIESPEMSAMGQFIRGKRFTKRYAVRLHNPVLNAHTTAESPLTETDEIERSHALQADVLTVPTESARRAIAQFWQCSLDRARIIGNPVIPVERADRPETIPPSAVLFGRLGIVKGVDVLARAVGLIRQRVPGFKATFIGPNYPWDGGGDTADAIQRFARETGGEEGCEMRAALPHHELQEAVRQHTLCVLPSRDETFGMAFTEAMMWSVPCVVSDIAPFRELAEDGKHCLFAESENSEDFAAKVCRLLEDKVLSAQIAQNAYEHAQLWSVNSVTAQLLEAWFEDAGKTRGNSDAVNSQSTLNEQDAGKMAGR